MARKNTSKLIFLFLILTSFLFIVGSKEVASSDLVNVQLLKHTPSQSWMQSVPNGNFFSITPSLNEYVIGKDTTVNANININSWNYDCSSTELIVEYYDPDGRLVTKTVPPDRWYNTGNMGTQYRASFWIGYLYPNIKLGTWTIKSYLRCDSSSAWLLTKYPKFLPSVSEDERIMSATATASFKMVQATPTCVEKWLSDPMCGTEGIVRHKQYAIWDEYNQRCKNEMLVIQYCTGGSKCIDGKCTLCSEGEAVGKYCEDNKVKQVWSLAWCGIDYNGKTIENCGSDKVCSSLTQNNAQCIQKNPDCPYPGYKSENRCEGNAIIYTQCDTSGTGWTRGVVEDCESKGMTCENAKCVLGEVKSCYDCGDGLFNVCDEEECFSLGNCDFIKSSTGLLHLPNNQCVPHGTGCNVDTDCQTNYHCDKDTKRCLFGEGECESCLDLWKNIITSDAGKCISKKIAESKILGITIFGGIDQSTMCGLNLLIIVAIAVSATIAIVIITRKRYPNSPIVGRR